MTKVFVEEDLNLQGRTPLLFGIVDGISATLKKAMLKNKTLFNCNNTCFYLRLTTFSDYSFSYFISVSILDIKSTEKIEKACILPYFFINKNTTLDMVATA